MSRPLCANALCREPFEQHGPHHRFCSPSCRAEEAERGTPRKFARERQPTAARTYQYQDLDRRGICPACKPRAEAVEVWLYREVGTAVVVCGRCAQRREIGITWDDVRLKPAPEPEADLVQSPPPPDVYQCPHGHREGYFTDKRQCKRCRVCHRQRAALQRERDRHRRQAQRAA